MRQTKASKFRGLLPAIEELLISYTYEGVIYLLEEKHDFKISKDTFSLYLHRERAKAKTGNIDQNTVLKSVNNLSKNRSDESNNQFEHLAEDLTIVQADETEDDSDSSLTHEELDALLEKMKRKAAIKSNKSLLDR
ncbi:MAG TPA: hypothetical protein VIC51_07000 [Psychromonas sp.]